jgi:hypothetical protein
VKWANLLVFCFWVSSLVSAQDTGQLITDSILTLEQVEQELLTLNAETAKLRELLTVSQGDSIALQESLTKYQEQAELLSKNYDQLWQTYESSKKSSDLKNWLIGGLAVSSLGLLALVWSHRN